MNNKLYVLGGLCLLILLAGCCDDPCGTGLCYPDEWDLDDCNVKNKTVEYRFLNYTCVELKFMIEEDYYPEQIKHIIERTFSKNECCMTWQPRTEIKYYTPKMYKAVYLEKCLGGSK